MPLKWFICPDNGRIEISDCLKEGGCRMGDRCATRSYLRLASSQRKWSGKPSTTQCIRGTMEAFLVLTKDYATSPDSRAFMIHGTKGHAVLEAADDDCSLLEMKFTDSDITGISDVIEMEDGQTVLTDYKTSGSYKIAKALGFKTVEEETGEVYKSGKKKGQPRTRKVLVRSDKHIDRWEWEYQLNKYRIEAEKQGAKIDKLKIQCICRDGGTFIARSRGVFRNVYYFQINRIDDKIINEYFARKRANLLKALDQGYWNEVCDAKENWDGLKCQRFCDVAEFCKYGKYLKANHLTEADMIKGLSEVRRLPRLGKIRLGIKKKAQSGAEYPAEVDYFVIDPQTPSPEENERIKQEAVRIFGEQPKQLRIMLPVPDPAIVFPQDYKRYGKGSGLKCKGDGETATVAKPEFAAGLKTIGKDEMGNTTVECKGPECPYYGKECSETAVLQFLIPELPGAGVWQCVTGSKHAIINLNSSLEYIRALCGRIHMIPLKLERRPQDMEHDGKKRTHYILHINNDMVLAEMAKWAQIDAEKVALQLPGVEVEKEDILFAENKRIEAIPAPSEAQKPAVEGVSEAKPVEGEAEAVAALVEDGTLLITEDTKTKLVAALKTHNAKVKKDGGDTITKGGFRKWIKAVHEADDIDALDEETAQAIIQIVEAGAETITSWVKEHK